MISNHIFSLGRFFYCIDLYRFETSGSYHSSKRPQLPGKGSEDPPNNCLAFVGMYTGSLN